MAVKIIDGNMMRSSTLANNFVSPDKPELIKPMINPEPILPNSETADEIKNTMPIK